MSKVYAIRRSVQPYFRELELNVMDIARYSPDDVSLDDVTRFSELNTSMAGWWQPIITNFYDAPDDKGMDIPEICPWVGGTLILSPKAFRLVKDSITGCGEFLPLKVGPEEYQIFNCLSLGEDDLAASEVEYDGDLALWVNSLVTAPANNKQLVFKSPLEKGVTLFCTDRFKDVVESFGLKGLCFDEVLIEV